MTFAYFFFIFYVLVFGDEKYELYGKVENVAYSTSRDYPCYVALSGETDRHNKFHACRYLEFCAFADRARSSGEIVRLTAKVEEGSNTVITLTYSGTAARFWINEFDIPDKGPFYCSCN